MCKSKKGKYIVQCPNSCVKWVAGWLFYVMCLTTNEDIVKKKEKRKKEEKDERKEK